MPASNSKQFVREIIEAEFNSGFSFARRIPSTDTWKTLAYIDALKLGEREALFELLSARGSLWLQSDPDLERQNALARDPAYRRFTIERTQASAWKYADPSFLRAILDGQRRFSSTQPAPLPPPDFGPVPLEVVENAEPPKTARFGYQARSEAISLQTLWRPAGELRRRHLDLRRSVQRPGIHPHSGLRWKLP